MDERRTVQAFVWTLVSLLALAVFAFPLDWAVWRARVAMGAGMGQVSVDPMTIASLKGGKSEYYTDGRIDVECSRSLFRHAGAGACWQLQQHPEVRVQE